MFIAILAILASIIGIAGSILPAIPGPIIGYFGMVMLYFSSYHAFSGNTIILWGVAVILLNILNYAIPTLGVKKFGGTKRGNRGSIIGMIIAVGIFPLFGIIIGPFGLIGLIAGPFLGAYIGEKMGGRDHEKALKAAIGSFIGFLSGVFLNIGVAITIFVSILIELIRIWSN